MSCNIYPIYLNDIKLLFLLFALFPQERELAQAEIDGESHFDPNFIWYSLYS